MLGSFFAGRYADRYPPTTTMIAGMVVACAGLAVGLALLSLGIVHVASIFGPCVCFGLGNGLTMAGASAGAMSVRPGLAGGASGLAGALSVAGAAAISSITGAILTDANSGYVLLGMMLASCLAALFAALTARRLEQYRAEAREPA
jgi:DHA1 family bicyclomycin/chloramphenicol resistance-like MFS transporter